MGGVTCGGSGGVRISFAVVMVVLAVEDCADGDGSGDLR
jgi:hypothetical protein